MIRILVADDHAVVREGLKRILAETSDMVVAGEASTGQEALVQMDAQSWDVVLLDISMPDGSGLDVLKQIVRNHPETSVLVLSVHPEDQYALRVLKAGASGYLTKESAPDQLVQAIRHIASGRRYLSPYLSRKLVSNSGRAHEGAPHERLSDREFQIMRLIVSGKYPKQIANDLRLSVRTIGTYRDRILKKMTLKSNAEIIHYAAHRGLL